MAVSGTGPVCVNLLIFVDSRGIYPWQSHARFTPDFPLNCNAIFQIVSKTFDSVRSLCQNPVQTIANIADSAKIVTNPSPHCRAIPLAAPFAAGQKGQLFEQGDISLGLQQRAMQRGQGVFAMPAQGFGCHIRRQQQL